MNAHLKEYLHVFIQDARELLQSLDDSLILLEKNPTNVETINAIFRAAHTLKGNSAMMGFKSLRDYAHKLESIISPVRSGDTALGAGLLKVLFSELGFFRETIDKLEATSSVDDAVVRRRIEHISTDMQELDDTPVPVAPVPRQEPDKPSTPTISLGSTIRVDVDRLDDLLENVGELVLNRTLAAEMLDALRGTLPDRVRPEVQDLAQALQHQGRLIGEIQDAVMQARMLPIRHLLERCPRIARATAERLSKQVDLKLSGTATELDKKLVDSLAEPLMHLMSNAIAHGIEAPEVRKANGKPETGLVEIAAYNEQNQVVVRVTDDGAGIDATRLRRKAGLPGSENEATSVELLDLLCTPGLSSATEVNEVAGRGVGMDVVRTNIERINGSLELHTQPAIGTSFYIRLPLTLAIVQALLLRYRGCVFALPLSFVEEVVHIRDFGVRRLDNRQFVDVRGDVLPIVDLDHVFHFDGTGESAAEYIAVVGTSRKKVAVPLEQVVGDTDVVMRSLNPLLGLSKYVTGASVLGNGQVVLILDVFSLLKS